MKLARLLLAAAPGTDNTAGGGGVTGREPGSVDNRLSLDPSDPKWADKIDAWGDGEKYAVTLEITQISPGEFEVTGVTDAKASEGEEGAGDEISGEEETAGGEGGYTGKKNPAIESLMGE